MFICIFVISRNCMIPGVEQSEVCYKTQRLAALPRQLQGGGTSMSGAIWCLPRGSLSPVGLAGWPLPAWHLPVIGNPAFPCESILAASGGRAMVCQIPEWYSRVGWGFGLCSQQAVSFGSCPVFFTHSCPSWQIGKSGRGLGCSWGPG